MPRQTMTLCLIHQKPRILLGMKKIGFGQGRWNGFGGKVEPGESIADAARREVREEAGVIPADLVKCGFLQFDFEDGTNPVDVHVFRATSFVGEPTESDEMRPYWFHEDEIPFSDMWADDAHWFPLFLSGASFRGHFKFRDTGTLVEYEVEEVVDSSG